MSNRVSRLRSSASVSRSNRSVPQAACPKHLGDEVVTRAQPATPAAVCEDDGSGRAVGDNEFAVESNVVDRNGHRTLVDHSRRNGAHNC